MHFKPHMVLYVAFVMCESYLLRFLCVNLHRKKFSLLNDVVQIVCDVCMCLWFGGFNKLGFWEALRC